MRAPELFDLLNELRKSDKMLGYKQNILYMYMMYAPLLWESSPNVIKQDTNKFDTTSLLQCKKTETNHRYNRIGKYKFISF